ncbi:LytR family transcriptional regulator [Fictibacillus phosphorivorans]|uniref:polyisoprenyl-teichoic acid--peptidoglycan teichoic acid transferase TagU n=1 Tax=Fictibacillus phosphorivorans TaxID=1221500 RepID=UPI003CF743A8
MFKKALIIIGCLIGLGIVGAGVYAYYLYDSAKDAVNEMHEPLNVDKKPKPIVTGKDKKPISILLMGVDERKNDRGRSDTMIVMTINPEKNSMMMFNIPRDTRTEIIGKGYEDKINHAYAFGGVQMAVDTVENFIDVPIDYYFKVNMESFQQIVDSVGGVTVNNPFSFEQSGMNFAEGQINLNGKEALAYSRMRKQDTRGDLGRNDRQKQVITSIINEGAKVSSITKFDNILSILGDNVKTNMTFDEMKDIQKNYKGARKKVESFQVEGNGAKIDGIYYMIVPEEERQNISTKVKEHLS